MIDDYGQVTSDDRTRTDILRSEWAPCFAHKEVDEQAAEDFIAMHGRVMDFSKMPMPTIELWLRIINRSPSSAPGPDGITYEAPHFDVD